jgi:glycosyltransferase involved in cell wall biosynthesis
MINQAETEQRMRALRYAVKTLLETREDYPFEFIFVDNGPREQTQFMLGQPDIHIVNKQNTGMGYPRRQGAAVSFGEYIAFCDGDVKFRKGWLRQSIELLETYSTEKLIATPIHTIPLKGPEFQVGELDGTPLYKRAGSGCLVMRRIDYLTIGPWPNVSECGRTYCNRAVSMGYRYIVARPAKVFHIVRKRSWPRYSTFVNGKWKIGPRTPTFMERRIIKRLRDVGKLE